MAQIARSGGTYTHPFAAIDFKGDRKPFIRIDSLFQQAPDSVLYALVDGFADSTTTNARFNDRPVRRGALYYLLLHNYIYRETDEPSGPEWPGNFIEYPTMARLRRAQVAWREALRKHWYSTA